MDLDKSYGSPIPRFWRSRLATRYRVPLDPPDAHANRAFVGEDGRAVWPKLGRQLLRPAKLPM